MRLVYGNMALQLTMYYVSSHVPASYSVILRHSAVFEPGHIDSRPQAQQ